MLNAVVDIWMRDEIRLLYPFLGGPFQPELNRCFSTETEHGWVEWGWVSLSGCQIKNKVLRLQGLARHRPKVSTFDNLRKPKASIFDDLRIRLDDVTPFESAEINDLNKNVLIRMERKTKMSRGGGFRRDDSTGRSLTSTDLPFKRRRSHPRWMSSASFTFIALKV